jgi:SAM-dependent methyltransferase
MSGSKPAGIFARLFGSENRPPPAVIAQQLDAAEAARRTLQEQLAASRNQLVEAEARVTRLEQELAGHRGPPAASSELLPPDHLQMRQVGGVWGPSFFSEGRVIFDQVAAAMRDAGQPLETTERILDFGCGCGRVLESFQQVPHTGEVWGADIDAEAIDWNRIHLGRAGQFYCNPILPPMRFPDGFFSAIYSISVFTHLPEEMQFAWLAELRRLLRPGGILLASLHGTEYWSVDPGVKAEVENRGFAYRTGAGEAGLPDFYMVAFHAEDYIRRTWSRFFEVVEVKPRYIHGVHDAAILRRRPD